MQFSRQLSLFICCVTIYGCHSYPPTSVSSQPHPKSNPPSVLLPTTLPARQASHIPLNTPASIDYQSWLSQNNHLQQVVEYKNFLSQHQVTLPVPDEQFFRSARNWQQCNSEQFSVPEPTLWNNALPTLTILNTLLQQQIISDIELTSTYRPAELNRCAGGAKSSSHLNNNAIDFRIGPPQPSVLDQQFIEQNKRQLCKFWQQHGKALNMGVGVYSTGQIHIDTQGFRTWGVDHTWHSSPCAEIIP